jgi:hypothetical protein
LLQIFEPRGDFAVEDQYGLRMGSMHSLGEMPRMMQWIQQKLNDVGGLVHSADRLLNQAGPEALGKPGVEGDPEHIVYVARRIVRIRKELLTWTMEFNCAEVRPECERLLSLISNFSKGVISELEGIPARFDSETSKALQAHTRGQQYTANLMFKLPGPNSDEIAAEFQRLSRLLPSLL